MVMSMTKFTITVPDSVVKSIDEVRGLIPRSTWIANELKKSTNQMGDRRDRKMVEMAPSKSSNSKNVGQLEGVESN